MKTIAPDAKEVAYQSKPPRSKSTVWKLARYKVGDDYVVGIGTFSTYANMFFARGREFDDGTGFLEGSGKDARFVRLREPDDVAQPALTRILGRALAAAGRGRAVSGASRRSSSPSAEKPTRRRRPTS